MEVIGFIKDHYMDILISLSFLVAGAEVIVRLTPTTKDDSAVERLGTLLRKLMDFLKVPNIKR